METFEVPVTKDIPEYIGEQFFEEGTIYALNCTPHSKKEALVMWRPDFSITGSLFDPATEDVLDTELFKDKVYAVIKTASNIETRVIDNNGSVSSLTYLFPLAEDAYLEGFATGLILGIEGKGLFLLKYDKSTSSFNDVFRLGACLWSFPQNAGEFKVSGSPSDLTTDIVQIDWTDTTLTDFKVWISRVVLYCASDENTNAFEWTVVIEDGDGVVHFAEETYREFSMPVFLTASRTLWTPLTFTFMKPMKPPLTVRVAFLDGDGSFYIEGASKVEVGNGLNYSYFTPNALHLEVGGTLCPDRAFVGIHRGTIFGLKETNLLEVASLFDLEFQDEFPTDGEPKKLISYLDGAYLFTDKSILSISSWSYKGLNVQTLSHLGIADKYNAVPSNIGIIFNHKGRLFSLSGGINEMNFSLIGDSIGRVLSCKDYGLIILSSYDPTHNLFRVIFEQTGTNVYWIAEEIPEVDRGAPLFVEGNIFVFKGGYFGILKQGFTGNYNSRIVVASPTLEGGKKFQVEYVDVPAVQNFFGSPVSLKIASYEDGEILQSSHQANLGNEVQVSSSGMEVYVPNSAKYYGFSYSEDFIRLYERLPFTNVDTKTQLGRLYLPTRTIEGRKFIIAVEIPNGTDKYPSVFLESIRLYGKITGETFIGSVSSTGGT